MAEFYSARGWEIPPLPWTNLSPPFSWDMGRREIEMLHALRMLIVGDYYRDNAIPIEPGWTVAKDGSCAVWDKGFVAFLDALDDFPEVLRQLTSA